MEYIKHYEALCYGRQKLKRVKSTEQYYELHHIVPKSLGGGNSEENTVLLTAREHFLAHLLLYNHYRKEGGIFFRKMAFALVSMFSRKSKHDLRFTSNTYALLREAARENKLGIKIENTENYRKKKSETHRESIRQARLKAPPRSQETREKLRQAAKLSNKFPLNYKKSICPFCKKEGQATAMKKWHFTNCKQNKITHA